MTAMTRTDITRQLAEFAISPAPRTAPGDVRDVVRRTIVNSVVLGASAGHHDPLRIAWNLARSAGSPPRASVLGTEERTGVLWAPLIHGIAMHVEDFDDTHLATVIHPGAPVVGAALTAAELSGASGQRLMDAVLAGVEVALRVGIGMCPSHFDIGWHITGTAGHLGAAAAAARLLGLDSDQAAVALALASVEAAGLTEANGSMTKSLHPGKAASDGLEAALLASRGITGPADPIEGARGLAALTSQQPRLDDMVDGLGSTWHTMDNTFKPYACGIVSHAVIDAGVLLRARLPSADDIRRVDVRVNPVVMDVMGIADPRSGLQSKFSVFHCFAVGFLRGAAGPEQFSDTEARAKDIAALRRRVHVTTDATVAKDEADVTVSLAGVQRLHEHVKHATGSLSRPLTDAGLRDKCRLVGRPVLGDRIEDLISLLFSVERLETLEPLFQAAVHRPPSAARRPPSTARRPKFHHISLKMLPAAPMIAKTYFSV
jgi:2-methylcitrate dehydratase PrpD